MAATNRIELAHEPDFALGELTVSPSRRALLRDDGLQHVVEHRVMQVLIALVRAKGGIITRDELTRSCWEGRVVGDDAINRVISRLRKAAEAMGPLAFRIETVTKIGYRLIAADETPVAEAAAARLAPRVVPGLPSRRNVMVGGSVAALLGILAGGGLLFRQFSLPPLAAETDDLLQQGWLAMAQDTREGHNQAIGAYRRVTEIAPDFADGWALLGIAYARSLMYRPTGEREAMAERAVSVARRALALDPDNGYARVALSIATHPLLRHWGEHEKALAYGLRRTPDDELLLTIRGALLGQVGRNRDALTTFERLRSRPFTPAQYFLLVMNLWCAGRVEQLERVSKEAASLYPTQFALWFSRFYIALFDGRPSDAIAQGEDAENRPSGIPTEDIEDVLAVARAAKSRDRAAIQAVMAVQLAGAHRAAGKAENAIQFACLFGWLDEAFAMAEAYYFGRGFSVPEIRFTTGQGSYTGLEYRRTHFLFFPSTAPMRADPRFARLTQALGLDDYWRAAHVAPDFRAN